MERKQLKRLHKLQMRANGDLILDSSDTSCSDNELKNKLKQGLNEKIA
jgi:hypothetical protein